MSLHRMMVLSTVKYLSGSKAGLGGQGMMLSPSSYSIFNRPCHQGQVQHYIVENLNIASLIFIIKLSSRKKSQHQKHTHLFKIEFSGSGFKLFSARPSTGFRDSQQRAEVKIRSNSHNDSPLRGVLSFQTCNHPLP